MSFDRAFKPMLSAPMDRSRRRRKRPHLPFFSKAMHCMVRGYVRSYQARRKRKALERKFAWMRKQPVRATLRRFAG